MKSKKKNPTEFLLSPDVLQQFRAKLESQSVMSKETGQLATESEIVEGLLLFYIRGDIVMI